MYEKFGHEARMTTTLQLLNSFKMGVTMRDGNDEVCTSKKERKKLDLKGLLQQELSLSLPSYPYPCKSRF